MMNSLLQQLSSSSNPGASSSSTPNSTSTSQDLSSESSSSSTLLSGLLGSNKKTLEKLSELKRENQELKSLEKLRPQLLDLQQQLLVLQEKYNENNNYYQHEIEILTEHNENITRNLTKLTKEYHEKEEELSQTIILIQQLTEKNKYLESESRQLLIDLDDAKYEIEQIRLNSLDPLLMNELQKKYEQLEIENKHLQRQKLTLSKDLNRFNTQSDSLIQIKEENFNLKSRVEELEAEKEAFKSMMEQLVESQPIENKSSARTKLGKLLKLKK